MGTTDQVLVVDLKSRFLDILEKNIILLNFERVLEDMVLAVGEVLGAEEVHFFVFPEWIEKLLLGNIKSELLKGIIRYAPMPELTGTIQVTVKNDTDNIGELTCIGENIRHVPETLVEEIGNVWGKFLERTQRFCKVAINEKRYRQLFQANEKFYTKMDMSTLLEGIICILKEFYPGFTYSLFLSQDSDRYKDLPIAFMELNEENEIFQQAFVMGNVQVENDFDNNEAICYVPLKGKQGVYGVLQMKTAGALFFSKDEEDFNTLFGNIVGNAIENVQLYQQSKKLVSDLQLINEVSHRLNMKLRLTETVPYLCEQIITSFHAQEVGFILFSEEDNKGNVLLGSTKFFFSEEAQKYVNYFKTLLEKDRQSIFIGDFNLQGDKQFCSIMAFPMIQNKGLVGFILVMHEDSYQFSFDSYKLLQSLIHHSTLAFVNSTLREELERMVITDNLTKLYSRNYLDKKIKHSMKYDREGTFILMDIDNFKRVNDTFGHQVGDEVLNQVAAVIKRNIRSTDIGCRWGGEELAIYLPKIPLETGVLIADRLVKGVKAFTSPQVTVSCGVSHWEKETQDSDKELFLRADQALYVAKNTGKNKVVPQEKRTN